MLRKSCTFIFVVIVGFLVVQWGRDQYPDQEKQIRASVYTWAVRSFPKAARQARWEYGLDRISPQHRRGSETEVVVLIHGLDEPGKIWMNLAPVLIRDNFTVYNMVYPNDQEVSLSSDFFFRELEKMEEKKSLTIIAHSMGGLVSRDMLTRPDIRYQEKVRAGIVPGVKRLIMIGTPNHGSQLARFRIFTEIRDQIYHWRKMNSHFLHFLLDGTGAAAVDLIPGSSFLTTLNTRPLPQETELQVIAGKLLPWNWPICDMIGDGLVSVDSARLKGIALSLVSGTHLSMIRNVRVASKRVPPAIPVIMEILENRS